jgi:2-hydroxychromene-2-carboxylate isomerase
MVGQNNQEELGSKQLFDDPVVYKLLKLELMFATQEKWVVHHKSQPAVFWDLLARIDIDMTRLQKDINDPAIRKVIQQDIADGALLGATKTPTFIVNGKHLPSFGSEQLQTLIETEIEVHY